MISSFGDWLNGKIEEEEVAIQRNVTEESESSKAQVLKHKEALKIYKDVRDEYFRRL
jgi:hypothetical protein